MFENFTDRTHHVLELAKEEARRLGHPAIGTEHLLLGLVKEGGGVGAAALKRLGLDLEKVEQAVEEMLRPGDETPEGEDVPFTPRAKRVLELAETEAQQIGHNYVGTEHILLGLAREGRGVAAKALGNLGIQPDGVRQTVLDLLGAQILAAATAQAGGGPKRAKKRKSQAGKRDGWEIAFKESSELASVAQIVQRLAGLKIEAVKKQHYEDAAGHRDQINELNEMLADVLCRWHAREQGHDQ